MSVFNENTWESDKIGDKLSQQLFRKKFKKVTNNTNKRQFKQSKKHKNTRKQIQAGVRDFTVTQINSNNRTNYNKKQIKKNKYDKNDEHSNRTVKNNKKVIKQNNNNANASPNKKLNFNDKNKKKSIEKLTKNNNNKKKGKILQEQSVSIITKSKMRRIKKKEKRKLENNVLNINSNNSSSSSNNNNYNNISDNNSNNIIVNKSNYYKKINVQKIKELLVKKAENISETMSKTKKKKNSEQCLSLRDRMMAQLKSSRFRYLNETLYNNESSQSLKMFKEDPESFKAYHVGYQSQVDQWPLNPLDTIIKAVKRMPKDYILADFGCGEARLAESVTQKVHSLDLVAINERITVCDMAHTPLLTNSINVVICCLSLMGSNLGDYIREANRLLKNNGILKIADVESRFDNINKFIRSLNSYGFESTWKDLSHNLFYFLDLKKVRDVNRNDKNLSPIILKPCLYKKR